MPPEIGAVHELSRTVTPDLTADAMGHRGVKVFAKPFLISLLEAAAGRVIEPYLAPTATSVGTMIDIRHLAATPVGMTVRARATLLRTARGHALAGPGHLARDRGQALPLPGGGVG